MTKKSQLLTRVVLSATLLMGASSAYAQFEDNQTCQPGIIAAFTGPHSARYNALVNALLVNPVVSNAQLKAQLDAVVNESSGNNDADYAALLASANALDASIATGRVVITLPDGTVVVDSNAGNNSFANYKAKTINENHNSRIAIHVAQHYQCGFGLETKISSSTGNVEAYFALRLGVHLDSAGTARISTTQ
jgi:hypothetical protein